MGDNFSVRRRCLRADGGEQETWSRSFQKWCWTFLVRSNESQERSLRRVNELKKLIMDISGISRKCNVQESGPSVNVLMMMTAWCGR
jgi:hypothetical protein